MNINGVWKDDTYKVYIYHGNSLYTTLECVDGNSVTLPNVSNIKGYSATNGASFATYSNGTTITPTGNMTLYAVYKVTYNAYIYHNGSLYTSYSCYEGDYIILPSISNIKGYSTTNGTTTATYSIGQYVYPSSNMYFYSVMKQTFTVTVYHNGSVYSSLSCIEGNSVNLPNISGVDGYSTTNGGTDVVYTNGGSINNVNSNITLYSVAKMYTVKIYARGDNTLMQTYTYKGTETFTLPSTVKGLPIAGYVDYSTGYTSSTIFRKWDYSVGSTVGNGDILLIALQYCNNVSYAVQANTSVNYYYLNNKDSYFTIINPMLLSNIDIVLNSNETAPYIKLTRMDVNGNTLSSSYVTTTIPYNSYNNANQVQIPLNFNGAYTIRMDCNVPSGYTMHVKPQTCLQTA